jgi:hypothetical protein
VTAADPALLADVLRGYLDAADRIIFALARDRDSYRALAQSALAQIATSERTVRALRQEIKARGDKWEQS